MQQYFSILKSKYAQESFTKFAHELLNDVEIGNTKLPVNSAFDNHIESFYYLGSFTDPQGKSLHVLDVNLKTNTKIEQARTMQRNLIARYLKDHWLDGALVAFHNDDSTSWRLSFVKVEYKYDEEGKPTEELTPARRYSFLVGEGEPSHTAQTQLAKIYELTSQNPTLAQLEEAFGVEKVTKEFFEKYRELFESVVAELKSNHTFQNEASKNNIDTESFAKKLLGQIVFLYFLQKKGWLGVPKGKSWGEGDKNFLRNIYDEAISETKNFFNNYLEVLFYDTLNNARNDKVDRNYSDFFQSKVPFLNGGLFEPQYDWKNSLMYLDNKLFDKILGVFDTYNFTVKEDEPLEKEVAVDPEMLGKVFENLLEENLRKGKGTYYTPREIVHYMCEESLVNYLAAETNLNADDVKSKYFPAYNVIGDEKIEVRDVNVSEKMIDSLKSIKIVDPACGSGAFLVGMLQQITQLRNDLESRSKLLGRRETASTEYEIKKQTIQNCIYGVDIDPGAIEIAKLRLWLSLVVDYDLEQIEPLPNLDYKLMQGNSLLEELVLGDTSVKLYDLESIKKVAGSKRMKNLFDKENQISLFDGDNEKVMKSLKNLQLRYFSTSDSESKKEIRNKIEKIEHELIETSVKSSLENLKSQKGNIRIMPGIGILPEDVKRLEKISSKESQIFAVLDELKRTGTKPFFLWHLYFADVFEEKGGFDIVIANPPYGADIDDMVVHYRKLYFDVIKNYADIYKIFFGLGLRLLKPLGILTFITPNTYLAQPRYKDIRAFLLDFGIIRIVNLGENVFDDVVVPTCISFIKNSHDISSYDYSDKAENGKYSGNMNNMEFLKISIDQVKQMLDFSLLQVYSLKNDEVVLDKVLDIRDAGIQYHRSGIGLKNKGGNDLYERLFSPDNQQFKNNRPVWYGKLINEYFISPITDEYFNLDFKIVLKSNESVSFSSQSFDIKEKILWRQTASSIIGVIDNKSRWFRNTIQCGWLREESQGVFDLKYILALLNSSYLRYLYQKIVNESEGRAFPQVKVTHVKKLPIKRAGKYQQEEIVEIVNKIFQITNSDDFQKNVSLHAMVNEYRKIIDRLVYKLYSLTQEEINIIEEKS